MLHTYLNTLPAVLRLKDDSYNRLYSVVRKVVVNGSLPMSTLLDKEYGFAINNFIVNHVPLIKCTVSPKRKWGEMTIVDGVLDRAELDDFITEQKVELYHLNAIDQGADNLTKVNVVDLQSATEYIDTGLRRPNINKAYNKLFKFDTEMLKEYYPEILASTIDHMQSMHEKYSIRFTTSYPDIVNKILSSYVSTPERTYSMGGNVSDSRGRAIARNLNKILNPIGYSLGRALLRLTDSESTTVKRDDVDTLESVYMFITELNGLGKKATTVEKRVTLGRDCYKSKIIPNELNHKIWTIRIYKLLDKLYEDGTVVWNVPIELDYSMSMGLVTGLLVNDKNLLDYSNGINNHELKDPWFIKGVDRHTAKLLTAKFYGSGESIQALAQNSNKRHKSSHLTLLKASAKRGRFAVLLAMKDLIVKGSTPIDKDAVSFDVRIFNDSFTIYPQKFNSVKIPKAYTGVDSDGIKKVYINYKTKHTGINYEKFRTYLYTLLVHNLDSQIIEHLAPYGLPIHDALVCHPSKAFEVRYQSSIITTKIYYARNDILKEFLTSIGVINNNGSFTSLKAVRLFEKLQKAIVKPEHDITHIDGDAMK